MSACGGDTWKSRCAVKKGGGVSTWQRNALAVDHFWNQPTSPLCPLPFFIRTIKSATPNHNINP